MSGAGYTLGLGWPEPGQPVQTTCAAVSLEKVSGDDRLELTLDCVHEETASQVEILVWLSESALDGQLDDLPGTENLAASFFASDVSRPALVPGSWPGQVSLRDEQGQLVLLTYSRYYWASFVEGGTDEVGRAQWLLDMGELEAYEAWNAPFGDMQVRHIGCAGQEPLRPGTEVEYPLVLEFEADDGLVEIYDRNAIRGLRVGGQTFDVVVGDAFMRGPLLCGDCAAAEVHFLVVRSD